jgi:hypothetical protein
MLSAGSLFDPGSGHDHFFDFFFLISKFDSTWIELYERVKKTRGGLHLLSIWKSHLSSRKPVQFRLGSWSFT